MVDIDEEHEDEGNLDSSKYPVIDNSVRVFRKSIINFKSESYYKMTPSSQWYSSPPILIHYNNSFIQHISTVQLQLDHEYQRQNVERHIKLVTDASATVSGHERRDVLIRNKIRSHKLMENFVSKKYFSI